MKSPRIFPAFLLAGALAFLFLTLAHAETTSTSIKFSDPAATKTLRIVVGRGDIHLKGITGPEVIVKSDSTPVPSAPRKDGLRVLTSTSGFALTEKNNVVVLDAAVDGWRGGSPTFDVEVPANVNVNISNSFGGDITSNDVVGDLEIKSMNGEIKLDNLRGGALVETMNGEITATVREVHEGKPISFTSTNGEISIRVPEDIKAKIRFRSQNGSILTDFDDKALVTKTEAIARSHRTTHIVVKSSNGTTDAEIHEAVRDAVREGIDAAKEAASAVRAAAIAARDAAREAANSDGMAPIPPIPPLAPLPPMTGGKIVSGTLNGGSNVEIQAATMNGDLTLRKISK